MVNSTIRKGFSDLVAAGLASSQNLMGCTEAEIHSLESETGVVLPRIYRDFLQVGGKKAGMFMVGTDMFLSSLASLQGESSRLLSRWNADYVLQPSDFVFAMHQGYQFLFFDTSAGNDPPVHLYRETELKPTQVTASFSDWFTICVRDEIAASAELEP